MFVCIRLFIEFAEPYNIVPGANAFQDYTVPNEYIRPYLEDGFEVVGIDPRLLSVVEDAEQPEEYYDTARYVYMVKEFEDVSSFDREKFLPDDYECTLLYKREDWVSVQNTTDAFRRENDPFCATEVPWIEYPAWPGTVTELTPEEQAAEDKRIQQLCNALRNSEIKDDDVDIIDLIIINGMLREELGQKEEALKMYRTLLQQYEDGVPFEDLQRQYQEYKSSCGQ